MRTAWVVILILAACSKKADAPAAGSAGTPPPKSADAAPPADAVAAAEVDAASDAAAADPKLAAIPEAGILLATMIKEEIVISRLDRAGIATIAKIKASETTAFGWLDAKTLVVGEPYGPNDKPTITKYVDGKAGDSVAIDDDWNNLQMVVTKAGDVWTAKCTAAPEGPEECTKFAYTRIFPSKKTAKKRPADVDTSRLAVGSQVTGQLHVVPSVDPPPDVKLAKAKVPVKSEDGQYSSESLGMKCTKGSQTSVFPDGTKYDPAYNYKAKSTRFVLADPWIYELVGDETNPVAQTDTRFDYFKPCEPEPLDGFIGLGGPLWGQYTAGESGGTWTFRVGTVDVATLPGGAIRANLP